MWKKTVLFLAAMLMLAGVRAEEIKKVMIIGNSIMKHGKAPQIGWNSEWGMAATAAEKDYAHLLFGKINSVLKQQKAPTLQLSRVTAENKMQGWDALKGNDADVIVIQLGDNYRDKLNVEEFQNNYSQMIRDLRGERNPLIVCLSNWSGGKQAELIEAAAKENNVLFVNLGPLFANPENLAKSEGHFTHGGVNWHPGDRGMAAIADAAFSAIEAPLKAKAAK